MTLMCPHCGREVWPRDPDFEARAFWGRLQGYSCREVGEVLGSSPARVYQASVRYWEKVRGQRDAPNWKHHPSGVGQLPAWGQLSEEDRARFTIQPGDIPSRRLPNYGPLQDEASRQWAFELWSGGMTYRAAGEVMGISSEAVRGRICRYLRHLRDQLGEQGMTSEQAWAVVEKIEADRRRRRG